MLLIVTFRVCWLAGLREEEFQEEKVPSSLCLLLPVLAVLGVSVGCGSCWPRLWILDS
jgi:hypothetical protein